MPLSNSSQKLKIVLIHGMNNSPHAFTPLIEELSSKKFDIIFITLPGHKGIKEEFSSEEALSLFAREFNQEVQGAYSVIAYSQGALYFELAQRKKLIQSPHKALYLAPAFTLKNESLLGPFLKCLPRNLRIRSFAPKEVRLHGHMLVHEYRTLLGKVRELKTMERNAFERLILIDPKDELVDPHSIREEYPKETTFFPRTLREKFRHHLIIHPNYFSQEEWSLFLEKIYHYLG